MSPRLFAALAAAGSLAAAGGAVARDGDRDRDRAADRPTRIDLPDGYRPEGIAAGRGKQLFVGSIPTGAVRRVDTRAGTTTEVVPGGTGKAAIGLKVDRDGRLFVAGGPTGDGFVYDSRTGAELARFAFAPDGAQTFVNDVVLAKGTAYFTDSRRSVLYALARDLSGFREIALPEVPLLEGNNLNGIEAARNGKVLLAIQGNVGDLWRINPATGRAVEVDLGGAQLLNGDGLLLTSRRKLLVVQNRLNKIAVLRLSRDFTRGRVVREITSPDFDVPTTVARLGKRLYLPNARFGTAGQEPADYWITAVRYKPSR